MGSATRDYFLDVLRHSIEVMDGSAIDHLVIGSIAMSALLGDDWSPAEDVDFLVSETDARRALSIFAEQGYSRYIRDPDWIYKVARPNVTIDLIFKASEKIELDEQMMRRSDRKEFEGLSVRVPSPEDMLLTKCLSDSLKSQGHWYDALRLIELCEDWDYIASRAAEYAPAKVLSLLLYASDGGAPIATEVLRELAKKAAGTIALDRR